MTTTMAASSTSALDATQGRMLSSDRPEHVHYDALEKHVIRSVEEKREFLFDRDKFDGELRRLEEDFEVPYEALMSFIRNLHLNHVKKTAPKVKVAMHKRYLAEYCNGASILSLAKSANYPPYLFARFFVESITDLARPLIGEAVSHPAEMIPDPSIIKPAYRHSEGVRQPSAPFPTRLAQELQEAVQVDPLYGPRHDVSRRHVGVEYEVVLETQLASIGIPFESEANLRARGTSRTPDVLLRTPVGVEVVDNRTGELRWKLISWIDSKALFGDIDTHHQSVVPQAESYVHRFGPGLIIYWFGHAPLHRLGSLAGEITIVGWKLPQKYMLPNGEIRQFADDV